MYYGFQMEYLHFTLYPATRLNAPFSLQLPFFFGGGEVGLEILAVSLYHCGNHLAGTIILHIYGSDTIRPGKNTRVPAR